MNILEFLEAIQFRITDSYEFQWAVFGDRALSLGWENLDTGSSCHAIFDTNTRMVYEVDAWDGPNNREYRWIHPDYIVAYKDEAKAKGVKFRRTVDDRKFIDLETEKDILDKVVGVFSGKPYDTRVEVPLDLSKEEAHQLMQLAHEQDLTLNQCVEKMLREFIDQKKAK